MSPYTFTLADADGAEHVYTIIAPHKAQAGAVVVLDARSGEILALAIEGSSSKVIATKLGISYRTVELHRSRLIEKLNVHSIAEFARLMRTPRR